MKFKQRKNLRRGVRSQRRRNRVRCQFESLEPRRLLSGIEGLTDDMSGAYIGRSGGEGEAANYVPGRVIVMFKDGMTTAQKETFLAARGMQLLKDLKFVGSTIVGLPTGLEVADAVSSLNAANQVKVAEPDYLRSANQLFPNDPRFSEQWDKNNDGSRSGSVADADIDAPEAWEGFGTGSSDVVIAIVDSGVDYNHEDLAANMWVNPGEIPGNGQDDDGNGYIDDVYGYDFGDGDSDPMDPDDHGTHVAGIAGAVGNNGVGVAGVNWNAKLMALRIQQGTGSFPVAAAIEALDYIVMMKTQYDVNIVVSNHSYGGPGFSQAEQAAQQAAISAGVVSVAAAGNDTNDNDASPSYPVSYPIDGLIAVAATTDADDIASFSNYGLTSVDIGAPGQQILSTVPNNGYEFFDGTSMASPEVAGAVAFLNSIAPGLAVDDAVNAILQGADPIPALQGKVATGARLNLFESAKLIKFSTLEGTVFFDANKDGQRDPTEGGLGGFQVYVDLNKNGSLDTDEPTAVTDVDGTYSLRSRLSPGQYEVRAEGLPNYTLTAPVGGVHTVDVIQFGDSFTDLDFGFGGDPGTVSGIKYNDLDGDGQRDPDEPGIGGIYIYVDLDNSGTIAIGEPAAITKPDGTYAIPDVPSGVVTVREVLPPGWIQTSPGGTDPFHVVNVQPGGTVTGVDFGNQEAIDYGDAPAPYPTLAADGGASHGLVDGLFLGAAVDTELDGIPDPTASGDDNDNVDDEDDIIQTNRGHLTHSEHASP